MKKRFSSWVKWDDRMKLSLLDFPGVYVLAITRVNLDGKAFSWRPEIVYIGMTNSKGGLKSRLRQFDNTIKGGDGHGGGHRFRFKHSEYSKLIKRLFVSVCPNKCNVSSNMPVDLRIMGDVAKQEYECFALFVEKFGKFPEFNDRQRSPKK